MLSSGTVQSSSIVAASSSASKVPPLVNRAVKLRTVAPTRLSGAGTTSTGDPAQFCSIRGSLLPTDDKRMMMSIPIASSIICCSRAVAAAESPSTSERLIVTPATTTSGSPPGKVRSRSSSTCSA
eukprot:796789-Prymnesium_polylepis.1